MSSSHPREWIVLLLGGHSGTGKTTVSNTLAQKFTTSLSQVDDFRLVLQRVTNRKSEPHLHSFLTWDAVADRSPEELRDRLIEIGRRMSYALEIVIAHHVDTGIPLILEGDGILPTLATQSQFAGLNGAVQTVFIIEPDEKRLLEATRTRHRGNFSALPSKQQQRQVRVSRLYGQWLQHEAERHGIPVVVPQPWDTLAERIVSTLR